MFKADGDGFWSISCDECGEEESTDQDDLADAVAFAKSSTCMTWTFVQETDGAWKHYCDMCAEILKVD